MPSITIEVDSERVQSLLKQLSNACSPEGFADTMKEIGEDLVYSTRQRFITGTAPDGSKWERLSDVTMAFRAKRGRRGSKPLIDTGTMQNSVSYSATSDGLTIGVNRQFGSNANAAVHQLGTDRAGRGRKVTIPARPFLGLSDNDIDGIERTIARVLGGRST
ncbi:MAG: phage virion morphogenesis protein [Azoarcus sp.]|jgi:phage virion morphogenesis protein|nr:phage virion morphogenesis protein [Azoarcus sp.]